MKFVVWRSSHSQKNKSKLVSRKTTFIKENNPELILQVSVNLKEKKKNTMFNHLTICTSLIWRHSLSCNFLRDNKECKSIHNTGKETRLFFGALISYLFLHTICHKRYLWIAYLQGSIILWIISAFNQFSKASEFIVGLQGKDKHQIWWVSF